MKGDIITSSHRFYGPSSACSDGDTALKYHNHDDPRLGQAPPVITETMLVDVLLLCVDCRRPIKARINTQQWIRVEWIGPSGQCQACWNEKKSKESSGV